VDDDLDNYVDYEEFLTMYRRCIVPEALARAHGLEPRLEPRKLFNLVQFLMYDKSFKGRVTVEETLQILFVRYGREKLDDEIKAIFGEEEKNKDGSDKEITYGEYLG
jgi:Ca2+-binding EF-hand superfamily protein